MTHIRPTTGGHPHNSRENIPVCQVTSAPRDRILASDMTITAAECIIERLDPTSLWRNPHQFGQGQTARSASFWPEVGRRSDLGGQTLRKLMWNVLEPHRVWYEAFYQEINASFRTSLVKPVGFKHNSPKQLLQRRAWLGNSRAGKPRHVCFGKFPVVSMFTQGCSQACTPR